MLKLWIVHRSPQQRASLARLSGLAEIDLRSGAPSGDAFATAAAPAAIVLGLEGDFELELDFAHRHHERLADTRWLVVCAAQDAVEAARLFSLLDPEILALPPTARSLRAFISTSVAHRSAASLADRQQRARVAERFSAWLGGVEVPGLLRALDPALSNLPLLVRGRAGSGRGLLCHYAELFRGGRGRTLRLHGRDLGETADLRRHLRQATLGETVPIRSIWIDEVDTLPISTQNTLAEWIMHGSAVASAPLRWIATAGESGFRDRLEPTLEQAFAPLQIEVPALTDHPETLAAFVEEVARDWTRAVGGPPRRFADSALDRLEAEN